MSETNQKRMHLLGLVLQQLLKGITWQILLHNCKPKKYWSSKILSWNLSHSSKWSLRNSLNVIFISSSEVKVHYFMCNCREFITKAKSICSSCFRCPCVLIILLLLNRMNYCVVWRHQSHINVVIATFYHLKHVLCNLWINCIAQLKVQHIKLWCMMFYIYSRCKTKPNN